MKTAPGFTFAGVASGIKPSRKDLALVYSQLPCVAAGCFTSNRARAAPVVNAAARLPSDGIRAVVLNSGNANALTGEQGLADVEAVHDAVARELKVPVAGVLSASTGVIGVRLPVPKVVAAVPALVKALSNDPEDAAQAILTTDTRVKMSSRSVRLSGKGVTLTAICKGSGMMAPQLATVLAVVVTDCAITGEALGTALRAAVGPTFNSLNIDNDMSTNDTVLALANGKAGHAPVSGPGPELDRLTAALTDLFEELAKEIASDGEGATKLLEVKVSGAPSAEVASDLARSVAGSMLVKAAMFGADPNWGRVLATIGARAGSQGLPVDPIRATVVLQGTPVYQGQPVPYEARALRGRMRGPEIKLDVDLGQGSARATAWGCDLSYDYVKINADYTSLIVQNEDGGVARDDRFTNYSPAFKVSLLVQALSYISRFAGKRCVIKYGGAALVKEPLKRAFCEDLQLLRSIGLLPIVVHGGDLELNRVLKKLGRKVEFSDGAAPTEAADLKVMEMVLSGSINSELVTMLNRGGHHAVGVSGKDGALLRARKAKSEDGRDLGQMGEVASVNKGFLEMLLQQGYVPVISPIGIGEDGEGFHLGADAVAGEIAAAVGADKLIFLCDVPGILDREELVNEVDTAALVERLAKGQVTGGMARKARAAVRALEGGVQRVHLIDGRTPHSVIAELFTERGVGTLVVR